MALVDMKSNLAMGAGKPLGNPDGRHDPDPDLKTSNLDFGPPNEKLTNPGGRHLDSPVHPPTPIEVPDKKLSKIQKAVAFCYAMWFYVLCLYIVAALRLQKTGIRQGL